MTTQKMNDGLTEFKKRRPRYVKHTVESLIKVTGHQKKKIEEALQNGWFGPVEIIKTDDGIVYSMRYNAVKNYLEGGYKKTVVTVKSPKKNTPLGREMNFYPYRYTPDDAREHAEQRAKEFMTKEDLVRGVRLNHPEWSDEKIYENQKKIFTREELGRTMIVKRKRLPIAKRREIMDMPIDFPALVLRKLPPEHAIYAMERINELYEYLGDRWTSPWVKPLVINLIREEIEINRLNDIKLFEPDGVQREIDEALTRSNNRLIKYYEALGWLRKRGESADMGEEDDEDWATGSGGHDL